MKKILFSVLTLLIMISTALPALALGPVDVDADLTYMSKYVWRGMVANPEAVLQPSFSANILGIGFGFWGNMNLTDFSGFSDLSENGGKFTEIDYVASYGLPLPLVDLNFGLIYYDFPNSDVPSTAEAFISGSVGILLSPTLSIYYDFKENDGAYVNAGISYPVTLAPEVDLDLGASLGYGDNGYNKSYFGVESSGMTDFLLTASIPFNPIPFFTITPSVNYSTQIGDYKTATDDADGDSDAIFYGLSVSFSF